MYAQEAASTQQEQKPVPRLDKSGVDAFQADLTQLSQQFSASFVVEGVPLRKTVLTEPAEAKPNVPQAVADFAAAYDYAAMKSDGVFMFRKNYTQPDDVPLVTLAECRLALHDATFLLGKFLYIPPPHPYIEPVSVLIMSREKTRDILFDSITDAQWKQILRPAGMHFADLKPEQQQGVIHYVLRLNSQTILARTLGTEYHLDILAQRKPVVCLRDGESLGGETLGKELRGLVLMGYEYPAKKNNYPVFRPQNYPVFIRPDSQAVQYGLVYDKNDKTKFINIGKDETEPSASDFALAKLGKAAPTVYLSEAVQKLNVRADKGGAAKSPAFAVDAALAEKPVLIVGDKAAPTVLFRALADVYGLRVTKDANGTQHMVRFRPKPPRTIQEMSPVLEAALPLPLQKVLHSQQKPQTLVLPTGYTTERNADMLFHIEAIKQMRAMFEPTVKAAKNQRVPLRELGPEAGRNLAVALLTTDYLKMLRGFHTHDFPQYINDPSRVALSGSRNVGPDGSVMVTLNVCEVKSDGSLSPRLSASHFIPAPLPAK